MATHDVSLVTEYVDGFILYRRTISLMRTDPFV